MFRWLIRSVVLLFICYCFVDCQSMFEQHLRVPQKLNNNKELFHISSFIFKGFWYAPSSFCTTHPPSPIHYNDNNQMICFVYNSISGPCYSLLLLYLHGAIFYLLHVRPFILLHWNVTPLLNNITLPCVQLHLSRQLTARKVGDNKQQCWWTLWQSRPLCRGPRRRTPNIK